MITMLHYDAVFSPTYQQQLTQKKQVINQAQHLAYLEQYPYHTYSEQDLEKAKEMLKKEMDVVKHGMAHGELSLESYSQVWEECLAQVLYTVTKTMCLLINYILAKLCDFL